MTERRPNIAKLETTVEQLHDALQALIELPALKCQSFTTLPPCPNLARYQCHDGSFRMCAEHSQKLLKLFPEYKMGEIQPIKTAIALLEELSTISRSDHPPGRVLRRAREQSGKSMGDMARHIGCTVVHVSDVERDIARYTREELAKSYELVPPEAKTP